MTDESLRSMITANILPIGRVHSKLSGICSENSPGSADLHSGRRTTKIGTVNLHDGPGKTEEGQLPIPFSRGATAGIV